MPLYFSQKALSDLKEIYTYSIAQWSESQANKYYFDLIQNCHKIQSFPLIGKIYSNVYSQPRGLKVHKHLVFYKIEKDSIRIIRILHESKDLKKNF
jgi:toxin ParE1/3/4